MVKRLFHFLLVWLWIGFAGGAAVLLFLAAPLADGLRARGFPWWVVNGSGAALALAWVAGSGWAAWKAAGRMVRAAGRLARIAPHLVGLVVCAAVFQAFLEAGAGILGGFRGGTEELSERFVFGPYPDAARMKELKEEGFTGVVTLLSPAVPFEAVLLGREREAAAEAGLELVEASMLPWVSTNEKALETLRALAKKGEGKYYIHCYLGRHRVDLVRFTLQEALGIVAAPPSVELPEDFERGTIEILGPNLALGPLPTRDEWFEYIVRSGTRRVFVLMDPENPDDDKWIVAEKQYGEASGIEVEVTPVRVEADAETAAAAVRRALAAGERVYVHAFFGPERSRRARWFKRSFLSSN